MFRSTGLPAIAIATLLLNACGADQPAPQPAAGGADSGGAGGTAGTGGGGGATMVPGVPFLIAGKGVDGATANPPVDWSAEMGVWNARAASHHPGTDRIAFEAERADILGGSLPAPGVPITDVEEYYQSGPETGTQSQSGTAVLYVADGDGRSPRCIGCEDLVDGENGAAIYRTEPSATVTAAVAVRQEGAVVHANRNKDLAHWLPDGQWLVAAVEMPRHALTHRAGCGEFGMFNDLWAISEDGSTWVQLTDYVSTWEFADPVAPIPYQCGDLDLCPSGCQYVSEGGAASPFEVYACSAPGEPPPAQGIMRPIVSNGPSGEVSGAAKVVWAERVGLVKNYVWKGALQIASADLVMTDGLPALVNYRRNLTPRPADPSGLTGWDNPGGDAVVGAGYETWSFSEDDQTFGFASDVFLSHHGASPPPAIGPASQAFTDSITWRWRDPTPSLADVTAWDATVYPYADNGTKGPLAKYGHWEEPIVQSRGGEAPRIAFASSADLAPPWDLLNHPVTFALETWLVPADRSAPAKRLTGFSAGSSEDRYLSYPTAWRGADQSLYLTVVPHDPGQNPTGGVYRLLLE